MKRLLFPLGVTLFILVFACSKSGSSSYPDYSGTYVGMQGNLSITMQVSRGATPNQIRILYLTWTTPANLNDNHFMIVPTVYSADTISGSGSFSHDTMYISYNHQSNSINAALVKQ